MFKVLNKKSFVSYSSRVKMVVPHNFNTQYMGGVHWMEIVESGQHFLNRGIFKILIDLFIFRTFPQHRLHNMYCRHNIGFVYYIETSSQ